MNTRVYIWISVLFLGYVFSIEAIASDSVAMVTDLKGNPSVAQLKERRNVSLFLELRSNTEVILEKDSMMVIIYIKSGNEFRVDGPARVLIGEIAPKLTSGNVLIYQSTPLSAEIANLKTRSEKLIQGSIRMRGNDLNHVELLAPHKNIFKYRPTFKWTTTVDNQECNFLLEDGEGNKILDGTQVRGGEFLLPGDIRLVPGKIYLWGVEFDQGHGNMETLTAEFTLASDDEREYFMRLKPKQEAPFSDWLIYSALLEQNDFNEEAQIIWRKLAKERPDLPELTKMLKNE